MVERERRFLVSELPRHKPSATRSITDLYIEGTRICLRLSHAVVDGQPESCPTPNGVVGHCGTITTMYLDEVLRVVGSPRPLPVKAAAELPTDGG